MKLIATHDGASVPVEVKRDGNAYRVSLGEKVMLVDFVIVNDVVRSMRLENGRQFTVIHHHDGTKHEISFSAGTIRLELHDPLALRSRRQEDAAGSGNVMALMPGRVVKIFVTPGEAVEKGAPLLILEAMKMQNEIQAPCAGVVGAVAVEEGQAVDAGAALVTIE